MEKKPVIHNRLRRMEKHDYTSACIYLITVTTVDRKPILGTIVGDSPDTAAVEPTGLGKYVSEAFRKAAAEVTKKTGCRVQVLHYQIMPDHFHGILYVRDTLPKNYSLGKIIAAWKSDNYKQFADGKVGEAARAAVLDMKKDISDALK